MKVDEYGVLQGARRTLQGRRPVLMLAGLGPVGVVLRRGRLLRGRSTGLTMVLVAERRLGR